jgi:hypothetical protein
MSWRGTLLLLILAMLAAGILLFSGKSHTLTTRESLIDFDPAKAEQITILEGGGSMILKKQNGIWMIASTPPDRANPDLILALLQSASAIKPIDTLRPAELKGNVSLETLDLKNPRRSLTIEANSTQTINFGVEGASPASLYIRLGSSGPVYLIPSEIAGLAFRPVQDFRDQRLSMLSASRLEEITFSKGNNLQQLVLRKDRQGWNLVSPLTTRGDQQAITAWADALLSTKIERWMPIGTDPASCGLDSPSGIFTFREEGGAPPVTVTIGSEVPGSPLSRYVRCSDRPEICVVSGIGSSLEMTPLSLRSKKLPRLQFDAIDRIEIHPAGCLLPPLLVSRKKGSEDWESGDVGSNADQRTLPSTQVKGWFEKIQAITAQGFEPATPDHLQSRGLNQPQVIRFIAHLSENTAEEGAGDMVLAEYAIGTPSDGMVALRAGNSPDLMIVPESTLELVKREALAP